jgi:DNA repair exonuclease SbcCD ATPase subunit
VYVLPKVKNPKTWISRLNYSLTSIGISTSYNYVIKTPELEALWLGTDTLDISDCQFVEVKKLGLPKLPNSGPQTKYQVIEDQHKRGPWTPDELEDYVKNVLGETEELEEDWYTKVETISQLNKRTIGLTGDYSYRASFWLVNSKKMRDAMLEIGWIERSSDEYDNKKSELEEISRRKRNMENSESTLKNNIFKMEYSKYVVKAIGKKPDRISRLSAVTNRIMKEDSFRSRILRNLKETYSYSTSLKRSDIRTILRTKG